jgi:hypothetical protein
MQRALAGAPAPTASKVSFLVHDAGAVSTFIVHRIKLQRSRLNPQMPMLRGWPVVCVFFLGRCVFDEE